MPEERILHAHIKNTTMKQSHFLWTAVFYILILCLWLCVWGGGGGGAYLVDNCRLKVKRIYCGQSFHEPCVTKTCQPFRYLT